MPNDKWITRWLDLADLVASWSEDPSTKVGAVVIDDRQNVLTLGWNGFPRGVASSAGRMKKPVKYDFFEHAERNAIYNASAVGIPLVGSTLYITLSPCRDCARAIIQAGIKEVYLRPTDNREDESALKMLEEAGIPVFIYGDIVPLEGIDELAYPIKGKTLDIKT